MRFRQFLSDVSEDIRKQWKCEYCIERKLYISRNCPLGPYKDFDEANTEVEQEKPASDPSVARSKYGFQQVAKKREEKIAVIEALPEEKKSSLVVIRHGDFEFTQCPVPSITENLMSNEDRFANYIVNMINWSESTGILPVDGGLMNQSNVFYESRVIVLSEQNKIEKEQRDEMDSKNKKNNKIPPSNKMKGN